MLIRNAADLTDAHVTPPEVFVNRRRFIAGAAGFALATSFGGRSAFAATFPRDKTAFSTDAAPNTLQEISTYNNFYEFGTGKSDPAAYAGKLTTRPWTIEVGGLVAKPMTFAIEDLLKLPIEERIYRHRCVEAWSMVIPWNGFALAELLKKVEPLGSAKYVAFETLVRPTEMPDQNAYFPSLSYPYVEGLRLDEAMHPLTMLAVGIYGEPIPNQNGAPIRLVVPWKYGFKGIKSIVKIKLVEAQPPTTWNGLAANEYGFYSNVNPQVDHPRWTQASERHIGAGLLAGRQPTLMFNGYADQVASLYAGMDLKANY